MLADCLKCLLRNLPAWSERIQRLQTFCRLLGITGFQGYLGQVQVSLGMERALFNGFQGFLPGLDVQSLAKQILRVIQISDQRCRRQIFGIVRRFGLGLIANVFQHVGADVAVRLNLRFRLNGCVGKRLQVLGSHSVVWINLQGALEAGFRGGQVAQIVETNAHRKDDLNILRHTGQGLAIKFSGFLVFLCPEIGRCQQLQPVRVFRLQLERAFHVGFKGLVILGKQRCGGRL